jgi:hypothetical protein
MMTQLLIIGIAAGAIAFIVGIVIMLSILKNKELREDDNDYHGPRIA